MGRNLKVLVYLSKTTLDIRYDARNLRKLLMRAGKGSRRTVRPNRPDGRFRIIGGEWRGRRFSFPALDGVRPTGDRVRETLFNWLQPEIIGARCLDLFAGSGALGLEALSRRAGEVVFVDCERSLLESVKEHLRTMERDTGFRCIRADAGDFLRSDPGQFNIVFLDPPFGAGRISEMCRLLDHAHLLAANARVYLETEAGAELGLPDSWRLLRSARAGNVGYHLAAVTIEPTEATD
jgi:16S rRNA (guanine966-N2)-methyltransferase